MIVNSKYQLWALGVIAVYGILCTYTANGQHLRYNILNNTFTRQAPPENRIDDQAIQLSQDRQEVVQYLNTKNIIKTMFKLLFGTNEENIATSRQVLNVFIKMLELLKSSFGERARSTSKSRFRDSMDSAAQAGISMMQGYLKSILSTDQYCIRKNICEGALKAARESRELGGLIAQLGG